MRRDVGGRRFVGAVALCALLFGAAGMALLHSSSSPTPSNPSYDHETPATTARGGAGTWENGAIRLGFPTLQPVFTVGAVSDPTDLVKQTITGIAEINGSNSIVSFASFETVDANWTLTAHTNPSVTSVTLNATVPVNSSGGAWESGDDSSGENESVGFVNVTIGFGLNGSSSPDPWTIGYTLNVSEWPWLNSSDSLGVEVRSSLAPALGYWASGAGDTVDALNSSSHAPFARFAWGANARTEYSGGGSADSSVGTYRNISSGGASSLVRLDFGSVTGGYTSLSYDPWVGILPAPLTAGNLASLILTPESLAVLALGGSGAFLLASWARTRRTPPESGL